MVRHLQAEPHSKAHLGAAEIRKILHSRTSVEVDFEVHGSEVRSRTSLQKGLPLFGKISAILRAVGRGSDVDALAYSLPACSSPTAWQNIRVPEHRVAGHDLRDRDQCRDEVRVRLRTDAERAAGSRPAQIRLVDVVLERAQ